MAGQSWSDPLDNIAKKISKSSGKLKNKQIAVLPFPFHDGTEGAESTIVAERLITRIVTIGKLQVIERSLLDKVMHELKLHHSGMIDQESAKKLGSILGVDAIITGTLIDLDGEMEVNARLIQAETGLVLTAAGTRMASQKSQSDASDAAEQTNISKSAPDPAAKSPASAHQTVNARASDEEVRKKMSAFFHTNKYEDPRYKEFNEDPPRPFRAHRPPGTVMITNIDPNAPPRLGKSGIFGPPEEFMPDLRIQMDSNNAGSIERIRQVWDPAFVNGEYTRAADMFRSLKNDFMREQKVRFAYIAQLYEAQSMSESGKFAESIEESKPLARLYDFPKIRAHALYIIGRGSEELGRMGAAENIYREIVQNYPFESTLVSAAGHRLRK